MKGRKIVAISDKHHSCPRDFDDDGIFSMVTADMFQLDFYAIQVDGLGRLEDHVGHDDAKPLPILNGAMTSFTTHFQFGISLDQLPQIFGAPRFLCFFDKNVPASLVGYHGDLKHTGAVDMVPMMMGIHDVPHFGNAGLVHGGPDLIRNRRTVARIHQDRTLLAGDDAYRGLDEIGVWMRRPEPDTICDVNKFELHRVF